ncbi:glucokinase [Planktotalea sp.]|uniref:glucokinase n=1 Tax=Planktotalea sp. TaxID=2029877 RepID=UPI0025CB8A1B|nr:glucokinase [Planktotalea sp.]
MTHTVPLILAADIGGTNTRVALLDGTVLREQTVTRYVNAKSNGLEDILRDYLSTHDVKPDAVSVALAGPVNGDSGQLTNLDWTITTQGASEATGGAMGVLLNDLSAQGHALPFLSQDALTPVQAGTNISAGPCLMIGLGTGMNVAPVHQMGTRTYVPPAEAGHTSFSPQDEELEALNNYLETKIGHVATEDVLSGRGLEYAYEYVSANRISAAEVMALCTNGDRQAQTAAGLLIRTLGHFAGDMALTHLPFGGIFLVGGVARALLPFMDQHGFSSCFASKGRFANFMAQFSVHLVQDDYAALVGAASYAQECLEAR